MPAQGRTSDDASDEDLMLAYAGGSAASFDRLYARHKGPVYRCLLRHCGNAATADELFQDVWTNVIRARATYVPTAKFTTWLYTLAHHRLVDHWRASSQAGFVSIDADHGEPPRERVLAIHGSRVDEPETRYASAQIRSCQSRAVFRQPAPAAA